MYANAKLVEENENGDQLFRLTNDLLDITFVELANGEIYFPNDFQGKQCESLEEVSEYNWLSENEFAILMAEQIANGEV